MSLVGLIPTWGTSTYMIAVIAAPKFFASPENQQEKVVQYAKDWLMPRDDTEHKRFASFPIRRRIHSWGRDRAAVL